MNTKKTFLNSCLCTLLTAATLTLAGCATNSQPDTFYQKPFGNLNKAAVLQDFQTAYDDASSSQKFNALILLTRATIVSGNTSEAQELVNKLYTDATTSVEQNEAKIVDALLLTATKNSQKAVTLLESVDYKSLPVGDATYYLNFISKESSKLATAKKDANYQVKAYKYKVELLNYVTSPSDRKTVLNQSVQLLSSIDSKSLSSLLASADNSIDKGFYEYTFASKTSSDDLKDKVLQDFTTKYPGHPLNEILGGSTTAASSTTVAGTSDETPQDAVPVEVNPKSIFKFNDGDKIAVLLPLSGRFAANIGEPAKLGILTALKDRHSKSNVVFYDTNKVNISQIVSTISSNGTKLVIGPILKPEVDALNNAGLSIPSIVLNKPESSVPVNQWYFDLGPNYEGAIVASKIHADGHNNPIVISNANDKAAERSNQSFMATFSKVNNNTTFCRYSDAANIKATISSCNLDGKDAAYINASVVDAVTAKASIPSNIPVYLSDKSYYGVNNTAQEFALSGATLGDMPWLLTDSPLKATFMQSLPKANNQVQKIFAAGYDSVNFAYTIERLAQNGNDVLHGLTGDISLSQNGLIESTPMWIELGKLR